MKDENLESRSIDDVQTAVFIAMTRYCLQGRYQDAASVVAELMGLLHHPHIELMPNQREAVLDLLYAWRERLAVPPHQSAVIH
ncbi:MAG: hypothetical protein ACU84Q_13185 [Gammaproteobacteria bacterium]